jgi:hypothetical protein
VNTGTALFIAAGAMAIIWAWAASKGGYISRDSLKYVLHLLIALAGLVATLLTFFSPRGATRKQDSHGGDHHTYHRDLASLAVLLDASVAPAHLSRVAQRRRGEIG